MQPDQYAEPEQIPYKRENLIRHLRKCKLVPVGAKPTRKKRVPSDSTDEEAHSGHADTELVWSKSKIERVERALVEYQHDNLLADTFIDKQSTIAFFEEIAPGIKQYMPSRRVLGGRILGDHAARCEANDEKLLRCVQAKTGGRVNLLSDVWQNIAKNHLMGCQLSLFGRVYTFEVAAVGDRHDGVAIAKQLEGIMNKAMEKDWDVGAIVTDNTGQCGRARRILALRWPRVIFLHCFAHDINNLVKAVLKSSFRDVATEAATAVNCMNASSSKWLQRARVLMQESYGTKLAFIPLCDTRWNSMQESFASLLRVRHALEALYFRYHQKEKTPDAIKFFGDPDFWTRLMVAEEVIRPLSIASYRLQRDRNTVADVVHSFQEIY